MPQLTSRLQYATRSGADIRISDLPFVEALRGVLGISSTGTYVSAQVGSAFNSLETLRTNTTYTFTVDPAALPVEMGTGWDIVGKPAPEGPYYQLASTYFTA